MPEARLERTRRAYDIVIDMGPHGCKLQMVGEQDHQALNAIWNRQRHWNVIEGEHHDDDHLGAVGGE